MISLSELKKKADGSSRVEFQTPQSDGSVAVKWIDSSVVSQLCNALEKAKMRFEQLKMAAEVCIYSTEEECDMSANVVKSRCERALRELGEAIGD